ncbi:mevalonate kinase [Streptococcus urinalis FB127-CNA-2]|uniref:Mevalonate kinase n=1 Tax=Streptococcus urinalis 2285-97 TaxID=764291 RepID=G5KFG0_9STRE|nr:mevalonate kinase [Streptococcus urinalis]EHJ57367.1 mevalonate kinase [Streptococcus urinalis 2285-97]EKS22061.1 mevalonate kinase [Streptococcus urinalis FB127-CNA-2]VEF31873.1 mevalonate kinase [Streptococcus urinalis]
MERVGIGKSHSKIILMGEHSVVYGYPAIAIPLKGIEVTCEIMSSDTFFSPDLYDPLSTAIYASLAHLKKENAKISYKIQSQVPQRRGMGSSAAVSIAAIRAVFDYYNQPLPEPLLEILVNQAEIIAHNNPSGLDAKTCLSDKAISFVRNIGFETISINMDAYLVIADTGIHGHTREAVNKVAQFEESNLPHLSRLGELAEIAKEAIDKANTQILGDCMQQSHHELNAIGVSIEKANHLVETALNHQALGAKMSGGGLGGCIIALTETKESALHLSHILEKEGAINTWIEKL